MVHLEFLELTDFKSYSGTHILGPLKTGLNCIVGSNGSGKSNLMDAICFVLGVEAKFLRGLRLNDLGYRKEGGGSTRSTEVTMRLRIETKRLSDAGSSDTDHRLMSFGRRVVDGKSHFLIESKIVERPAYLKALAQYNILPRVQNCIVSQGQVEAWSLNTDKEKAQLFDEVSGSAQYKEKYDTLKKSLQQTKLTQSRVQQEATTFQKEYKSLKAQWDELKAWQALEEEVKLANVNLHMFKIYINENASNKVREQKEKCESEIERLEQKSNSLQANQRQNEQSRRDCLDEISNLDKKRSALDSQEREQSLKVEDLESQTKLLQETIQTEELNKQKKKEEIEELYAKYSTLGEQWVKLIDERVSKTRQHEADVRKSDFTKLSEKMKQVYLKEKEQVVLKTAELQGQLHDITNQRDNDELDQKSLQRQAAQSQIELEKAQAAIEDCTQSVSQLQQDLIKCKTDTAKFKTEYERIGQERDLLKNQKNELSIELEQHQRVVLSFSQFRNEDYRASRFRNTLDTLKAEIPGVFDRVTGLCDLTNQRFATAVSTALGFQADSVVVDTFASAKRAIAVCKRLEVPPIEFLPLDTIRSKNKSSNLRNYSHLFTPLLDVIQFESRFESVFSHILEDTVIVDDLEKARKVAYADCKSLGLCLKVVTLDGQSILRNMNMKLQGPRSGQMDRFAQKQRDTASQKVEELRTQLEPKERMYRKLDNEFYQGEMDFSASKIELDRLDNQLKLKKNQLELFKRIYQEKNEELDQTKQKLDEISNSIDRLNDQIDQINRQIEAVQAKFYKTDELINIAKSEHDLISLNQSFEKQMAKLKDEEHQFQIELNEILRKLGGDPGKKDISDVMLLIEDTLQHPEGLIFDFDKVISGLACDLAKVDKDAATEASNLNYIRERLETLTRSLRDKNEALNTITISLQEIKTDTKRTFHKLTTCAHQLRSCEQELEVLDNSGLELIREIILKDIQVPVKGGTFEDFADIFGDNENHDSMMNEVEIDFSQVPEHWSKLEGREELIAEQESLEKTYLDLKEGLATKGSQNHKAEEALEEVKEKLRQVNQDKDKLRKEELKIEHDLNKVSEIRKEKFLTCFNHTQAALKQIYATLTEPPKSDFSAEGSAAAIYEKHFSESVGGSATLELEDVTAGEPFNHGIIFTAMPYGKRYTEMELLSGGEKSMATLALLFSLQSYRQSPFVVLDEVDAALDAANVDALRRFLQRAKFQVVIVTLKEEMYCHADAIIGVYKDQVAESSETVTLDVEAYPAAFPKSHCQQMTLVN